MSDIVDRANDEAQHWLDSQIANLRHEPTDDTECVDCGEPIGAKRKQAVPWAVRCMKCQTACEGKK